MWKVLAPLAICAILASTSACAPETHLEHRLGGKTASEAFGESRLAALARAACAGDASEVELQIKNGADPNGTGEAGFTPLFWAVDCSNIQGLEALLKAGADPNFREKGPLGSTPVFFAASSNNPQVLKLLLKRGGDANAAVKDNASSALMNAFRYGAISDDWENYYTLLDGGANIQRVYGGMTIANFAAGLRRYDKVAELLGRGFNRDLISLAQEVENDRFLFLSDNETVWRSKVKTMLEQRGVHFPIAPRIIALVTMAADGTVRIRWLGGQKPTGEVVRPSVQYVKPGEREYNGIVARAGELKPYGTIGAIPYTLGDPIPIPPKALRD